MKRQLATFLFDIGEGIMEWCEILKPILLALEHSNELILSSLGRIYTRVTAMIDHLCCTV